MAAVALIIAAHKRRAPDRPWVAYCPVAILMFSVVQAENTLWGFQLAWYLILLLLAGVLFLLDRPTLSIAGSVGAIVLAIVGSYSSFQGLFIWVAGLLLLFYRRRPGYLVAVWVAAAVLTTALYFYNFNSHAAVAPELTPIHLPTQAVRFYFESLGDVLGVRLSSYGVRADLITAVGCVIFAVAIFTLWSSGRRRDAAERRPHWHRTDGLRPPLRLLDDLRARLGRARGRVGFAVHDLRPLDPRRRILDVHRDTTQRRPCTGAVSCSPQAGRDNAPEPDRSGCGLRVGQRNSMGESLCSGRRHSGSCHHRHRPHPWARRPAIA